MSDAGVDPVPTGSDPVSLAATPGLPFNNAPPPMTCYRGERRVNVSQNHVHDVQGRGETSGSGSAWVHLLKRNKNHDRKRPQGTLVCLTGGLSLASQQPDQNRPEHQAPPGGSRGVSRSVGTHNPSSEFWVSSPLGCALKTSISRVLLVLLCEGAGRGSTC